MPLSEGCSQDTVASNIRELMHSWEQNNHEINGDKIPTRKEAMRRAIAIATSKCPKEKKDDKEIIENG